MGTHHFTSIRVRATRRLPRRQFWFGIFCSSPIVHGSSIARVTKASHLRVHPLATTRYTICYRRYYVVRDFDCAFRRIKCCSGRLKCFLAGFICLEPSCGCVMCSFRNRIVDLGLRLLFERIILKLELHGSHTLVKKSDARAEVSNAF